MCPRGSAAGGYGSAVGGVPRMGTPPPAGAVMPAGNVRKRLCRSGGRTGTVCVVRLPLEPKVLERVPQRPVPQTRVRAEESLDCRQCALDVTEVEAVSNSGEAVRFAVGPINGLEAGERRAGQGGQHLLATDLVAIMVKGGQHTVGESDAVWLPAAFDDPEKVVGWCGTIDRWRAELRHERGGHKRVQPIRGDRPASE